MTHQEKLVVSAYTGYLMVDYQEYLEFINAIMGRKIFTHELAREDIQSEIRGVLKEEFLRMCKEE